MTTQFIMLAVCATLVQIALVMVSPTAAMFRKEDIDDIELLRIHRQIGILRTKEVTNYFFPHNIEDYWTKLGLKEENGTEICISTIFPPTSAGIETTFEAAMIANPKITSIVTKAHPALLNALQEMVKGICSAMKLATGKKSLAAAAAIKAIADQIVPAATIWNQRYFDVVKSHQDFHSEIRHEIEKAEIRSTHAIVSGVNKTFIGLQKLASSNPQVGSEEVSSIIEPAGKEVNNEFLSSLSEKFDIAEIVFINSRTSHSGRGRCSSAMKNRKPFIKCEDRKPLVKAASEIQAGLSAVFDTILRLSTVKNPNWSQGDYFETEAAINETSALFTDAIDAAINGILDISPGSHSILEAGSVAAKNKMEKIVVIIYESIRSIGKGDPGTILSQLRASENETLHEISGVVKHVYDAILAVVKSRFPEIDAESLASVQSDQEKTVTEIKKSFTLIFTAIRVRIIEISSGIRTEGETIVPPLKATQAQSSAGVKAATKIVVGVIIRLLKAAGHNNVEIINFSAIESCQERTLFQLAKGIAMIFSNVMTYNQNAPKYISSDIIEAGRKATTASYLDGLENMFCGFLANDTGIIAATKEKALSAMQIAVDSLYDAVQATQGDNSCEMVPRLETMEATTARDFRIMIFEFFDGIRKSPNYDVQLEPALNQTLTVSLLNSRTACVAVFNAIRTLAALNCPGSKTSSVDNLCAVTAEYDDAASKLVHWSGTISDAVASLSAKKEGEVSYHRHHVAHTVTYEIQDGDSLQTRVPTETAADADT